MFKNKKKRVKYLIEVLVISIIASLMMKFIPFRLTKPLPTWGELLCLFPLMILLSFIAVFIGELRKKSK